MKNGSLDVSEKEIHALGNFTSHILMSTEGEPLINHEIVEGMEAASKDIWLPSETWSLQKPIFESGIEKIGILVKTNVKGVRFSKSGY